MKLVISDTNIFIDLFAVNLLEEFFMLPYEVHTVELVLNELSEPVQKSTAEFYIHSGKLIVAKFTPNQLQEIITLYQEQRASISFTDCEVWHYARKTNGILLSGDKRLRNKATASGIEVHGILFLIEQLVVHHIISQQTANLKLEELRKINPRLPR